MSDKIAFLDHVGATLREIQEHPVAGMGLMGYREFYEDYKMARHTETLLYPHNFLLNFWVEIGLLGFVSFVWILVYFFQRAIQALRSSDKEQKVYVICISAGMVALLVHGLVDVPYFKNDLAVLFWALFGLMEVHNKVS